MEAGTGDHLTEHALLRSAQKNRAHKCRENDKRENFNRCKDDGGDAKAEGPEPKSAEQPDERCHVPDVKNFPALYLHFSCFLAPDTTRSTKQRNKDHGAQSGDLISSRRPPQLQTGPRH